MSYILQEGRSSVTAHISQARCCSSAALLPVESFLSGSFSRRHDDHALDPKNMAASHKAGVVADDEIVNLYKVYGGSLGAAIVEKNADGGRDLFEYSRSGGSSVGIVRMHENMSPLLNYFELEITCDGRERAIGIGVGDCNYPLTRMPGWNPRSIGFHADDGKLYHQAGFGAAYGPLSYKGDRMGVGVDFETECGEEYVKVWFTRNGEMLNRAITVKRPMKGLYPLIGMHSEKEQVRYLGHRYCTPNCGDDDVPGMHIDSVHPLTYWLRCNGISFGKDPRKLFFRAGSRDVSSAVACSPLTAEWFYFEVCIDDGGEDNSIGIGVSPWDYSLDSYPGWRSQSVGYHGDNGCLYKEHGNGKPFGPKCEKGDVMGCGVLFGDEAVKDSDKNSCIVFFTRNGEHVGQCEAVVPKDGFYPMVSMSSPGQKVTVAFDVLTG